MSARGSRALCKVFSRESQGRRVRMNTTKAGRKRGGGDEPIKATANARKGTPKGTTPRTRGKENSNKGSSNDERRAGEGGGEEAGAGEVGRTSYRRPAVLQRRRGEGVAKPESSLRILRASHTVHC